MSPPAESEIAAWLNGLGLGQYVAAFEENHLTFDVLADLTDEDLRACGVDSLGHRKTLLEAIRRRFRAPAAPAFIIPPVTKKTLPPPTAFAQVVPAPEPVGEAVAAYPGRRSRRAAGSGRKSSRVSSSW